MTKFPSEFTLTSRIVDRRRPVVITDEQSGIGTDAYLATFAPLIAWTHIDLRSLLLDRSTYVTQSVFLTDPVTKAGHPNEIFEAVRTRLAPDAYFAFRTVTAENVKQKFQQQFSGIVFWLVYPLYFLVKRLLPKVWGFRFLYRKLSIPADMSKAEIIGRLIYKGFEMIDVTEQVNETLLVARVDPKNNPSCTQPTPCEGLVFRMNRVGKNGRNVTVYKFRSMHPYAEFVLEYLHKKNGLDIDGKFRNDFRVSTGGKLLRRYWIDELPMLVNLLKGDLKLIGVRPISAYYFKLYPAHLQELRRRHKPGLLPPFYADMPRSFEEIVQSEVNYLTRYEQAPWQTDMLYLKRILSNILVKRVRSK